MLSEADKYLREHNSDAYPILYGQDHNDESWAVCKSDMLLKGENAGNIILGDTFTHDGYTRRPDGRKHTFDYMLANPPFGVEWKQQQHDIKHEAGTLGYEGRFGAGLPSIDDGSLLFLQHMLAKMQPADAGGSRLAIVFNGSPLFKGDAGSGESNIRKWIIENDWLEAIVALPDQIFYNTGISTYIWVLTNRKEPHRKGKIQLIDGRQFFVKMRKSLGQNGTSCRPSRSMTSRSSTATSRNGETRPITDEDPVMHEPRTRPRVVSKVFTNKDFGYRKVTVECPLRLNFAATPDRIALIEDQSAFQNLTKSKKRPGPAHDDEVALGPARQEAIRGPATLLAKQTGGALIKDREAFVETLNAAAKDASLRISAPIRKAVLAALGERDPEAAICIDRHGNPEADKDFRGTETVPLREEISEYFAREVLPHFPYAWVNESKTKVGYEIR